MMSLLSNKKIVFIALAVIIVIICAFLVNFFYSEPDNTAVMLTPFIAVAFIFGMLFSTLGAKTWSMVKKKGKRKHEEKPGESEQTVEMFLALFQALREKGAELNEAQKIAHIGSWYWDAKTDVTTSSEELFRIFGIDPAKEHMPAFSDQKGRCYPVEEWERLNEAFKETIRTGVGYEFDVRAFKNGKLIWVTTRSEVVRDQNGQIMSVHGSVQDITERKKAEESLRESEEKYRELVKCAPTGIYEIDFRTKKYVSANDAMCILLGYTREELLSMNPFDFLDEEGKAAFQSRVFRWLDGEKPDDNVEYKIKAKDGHIIHALLNVKFRFDKNGKPSGATVVGHDITGRKMMEETLAAERENLQNIFDVVNTGLILIDGDGDVMRINNVVAGWSGKNSTEIFAEVQPGDILGCIHAMNDSTTGCGASPHCRACPIRKTFEAVLRTGESIHGVEAEVLLKINGKESRLWLDVSADPLTINGIRHVILALNDITERKRAEDVLKSDKETLERLVAERSEAILRAHTELARSKRLSDMGALAATVAHELRNPLSVIKVANYNIKRKTNGDIEKHTSTIDKKIEDSNQIINNLLFYTRIRDPHFEKTNISAIVLESEEHIRTRYGLKKEIIEYCPDEKFYVVEIMVDPVQLREVISNILNNSVDAISKKENGRIEVRAKELSKTVEIHIKDNGVGMTPEALGKLYEPFFTTKSRGTGLGLAVVKQIIDNHKGNIRIESKKNHGTAVVISLPKNC
jgi:PAS domain S-box-containing protein